MVISMVKYIFKNYIRQYINLIKKNKIKFISGGILGVILISISIDFLNLIAVKNCELIYIGLFIYSIAKLFQDIPVINLSYQLIEFRILKLWQLKSIILIKSIYSSIIVLNVVYIFPDLINKINFYRLTILLLINVSSNIICFFLNQINKKNILRIVSLVFFTIVYYLNSMVLILAFLIVIIVKMIKLKYINYELMLPYSHALNNIFNSLVNGDFCGLAKAQEQVSKSKSYSEINLIEKYYDSKYFSFFKEISRALYYNSKLINISVTNFIIGLTTNFINANSNLIYIALFICILYICDSFLSILNSSESINMKNGFYFPYELNEILNQKYIAHLCIVLIPLLSSFLILKHINLISFIICLLVLPVRNILNNFSTKKFEKYIGFALSIVILLSCFSI